MLIVENTLRHTHRNSLDQTPAKKPLGNSSNPSHFSLPVCLGVDLQKNTPQQCVYANIAKPLSKDTSSVLCGSGEDFFNVMVKSQESESVVLFLLFG